MIKRKKITQLLLMTALGAGTIMAPAVMAQSDDAIVEEVVVTGSRIKRLDLTSVGPVTTLTETEIEATGITNLEVLLQRLPSAAGFGGNQTAAYWTSNGWGTPQINLRGLGINRTLVLVNGRRVVNGGTGANSSVDLSMIPMSLISRVEVLKDGASATYGADAVAGVVNLITKKSFEGLEIEGKYGQTDEEDGREYLIDATWGVSSDRGNVMMNLSFQSNEAMPLAHESRRPFPLNRDGSQGGSSATIGGRTTLPAGYVMPDGSVLTNPTRINFNQGAGSGDFFEVYDSSKHPFNYNPYFNAVQPIKRISFTTIGDYEVNDNIRMFAEFMLTHRESSQPASPATLKNISFDASHPTNPTGVDFNLERRRLLENGSRDFFQEVDTWRAVTGFDGDFGNGWSYEVAFNWGRNTGLDAIANNINMARLNEALDTSVCGSGGIPCADILGYGDVTQDVLDYIVFNQTGTGGNEQIGVGANITGDLFDLPAGTVGFAGGVEWRKDTGWRTPDSLVTAGFALGNQADPISGSTKAKEIYGEVSVPLFANTSFAKSMDLDVALRYSDYDLFGGDENYKIGLNWVVNDMFKVRGTMASAFRIPNVPELFGGVSEGNMTTVDPCNGYALAGSTVSATVAANCAAAGVPANFVQLGNTILTDRGGNPALQPESAKSMTIGVVLQPSSGLSFTFDYFDIDISDAMRETSGSTKLAICYDSPNRSHAFCGADQHTRNTLNGDVNFLSTQKYNTGGESMKGLDFGAVYNFATEDLSHTVNFQATYLMKYETTAFVGDEPTVFDGFIGSGNGGYPRIRAFTSYNLAAAKWNATYSIQMIGRGDDFNDASGGVGSNMPNVFYHNVQFSYEINDATKISAGIDNLFQKDPPRVSSWTDGNTDTMTYDLAGRRGYVRIGYTF
ncbi:MAG: TonB-dependent receptor domain-containing protein [Sphingomonadales bacterium]